MIPRSPVEWQALLAFYAEAGVDMALGETPIDRFAESAAEAAARSQRAPQGSMPQTAARAPVPEEALSDAGPAAAIARPPETRPTANRLPPAPPAAGLDRAPPLVASPPDEAAIAAREAARTAGSLDALRAIMDAFDGCALKRTASRLVFADGNPQAKIMFVGEAPGRDEDQQGLPFVGRSGQLLDRMMAAIGLDRTSAYIANIIPWRPPGNRTPTPQETAICLPFITRQIALVDPDLLVCLGGPSAHALMATTEGITRLRGRFMDYDTGTRTIRAVATFHPAYLLRTPIGKRLAWRDMLAIEAALKR